MTLSVKDIVNGMVDLDSGQADTGEATRILINNLRSEIGGRARQIAVQQAELDVLVNLVSIYEGSEQ